ncbi:unnamed protein product [Urochloa humidicola]
MEEAAESPESPTPPLSLSRRRLLLPLSTGVREATPPLRESGRLSSLAFDALGAAAANVMVTRALGRSARSSRPCQLEGLNAVWSWLHGVARSGWRVQDCSFRRWCSRPRPRAPSPVRAPGLHRPSLHRVAASVRAYRGEHGGGESGAHRAEAVEPVVHRKPPPYSSGLVDYLNRNGCIVRQNENHK